MKLTVKSIVVLVLMLLSAALGAALRPRISLADERPPIDLATMVPKSFGDWREEVNLVAQVVNPQQRDLLNKIYSQTLSRTYVNTQGYRVMLSIAYGADAVTVDSVSPAESLGLGLQAGRFWTVVARPEPENSLLEIVQGYSAKPCGMQLVVLGNYDDRNVYHRAVKAAASPEVRFVGAIYDKTVVQSLRAHSAGYVHGHQVGGTNPSLVEALGAGNAVIAHDNRFNRWVVGEGAMYFTNAASFAQCMDRLLANPAKLDLLRQQGQLRFAQEFTWPHVLRQYEALLSQYLP